MKRSKAGICLMVLLLAGAMQGQAYAHGGGGHGGGGHGGGSNGSGSGNHGGHGGFHGHGHGGGGVAFVGGFWFLGGYAPGAYYYYDDTSPWNYGPPQTTGDYIEIPAGVPQQGEPSWYYCDNPAGYYPYVQQCASGWQRVTPYGQPGKTQTGPGTY